MKVLGITAEYNPFHNGHAYHIREAVKRSEADCCTVVMSGNFTQRGEPAVADKWERAKQAVSIAETGVPGADLVIELPFAFACNRAEIFAAGAVDCLVKTGADSISFGCEAENPDHLRNLAFSLEKCRELLEEKTCEIMQEGYSRAKAYHMSVEDTLGSEAAHLMKTPNNILALEYMKRIMYWNNWGKTVEPLPVRRIGSTYRGREDIERDSGYAGASAIREMIDRGQAVDDFVPYCLCCEKPSNMEERLFLMLKTVVLRSSPEELAGIYSVGEGLNNKLKTEINESKSMEEYVGRLVSRRYTAAFIRRMLTYVLLGLKKKAVDAVIDQGASRARILAADSRGRELTREIRPEDFTLVTNVNREKTGDRRSLESMEMTIDSSDMYNLIRGRDMYRFSDRVVRPYIV